MADSTLAIIGGEDRQDFENLVGLASKALVIEKIRLINDKGWLRQSSSYNLVIHPGLRPFQENNRPNEGYFQRGISDQISKSNFLELPKTFPPSIVNGQRKIVNGLNDL